MAKTDNLTDFLTDIADAIREKKGTTEKINPQDFSSEIASIESGGSSKPQWTGHADAEGLRAIGWTDEDIAYYQANGVNWNAEDDKYHLVSDDNKALYGVLTAANILTYKNRIVYLPKIDTSGKSSIKFTDCACLVAIPVLDTSSFTTMGSMFYGCSSLIAIPPLNTSAVKNMSAMFSGCCSLVYVPPLDTSNVTTINNMFYGCYSLVTIPPLNTSKATTMARMFYNCYNLVTIPPLDTSSVTTMSNMFYGCSSLTTIPMLDTSKVTTMTYMFNNCFSLISIPPINTASVTDMTYMFRGCYSLVAIPILNAISVTNVIAMVTLCHSLRIANITGISVSLDISYADILSKESLLYIINNEAAASAITIKLASYAYTRLAEDADVLEALANHPNISISQ